MGAASSEPSVPHLVGTDNATFTLPPLIPSRTQPVPVPDSADLDSETENIEKNKKWFLEHGGNFDDLKTIGGMTLDLPENAPPMPADPAASSVDAENST